MVHEIRVFLDSERAPAFWVLLGFFVTFALTRAITRRIRTRAQNRQPGEDTGGGGLSDVYIAGVHVHHQVWGILLVLVSGLIEFRFNPDSPWSEILAAGFGTGAALALDEFALWFHLDDVYWAAEGRKSIDAILVAGAIGSGMLLGASPIGVTRAANPVGWIYTVTIALNLLYSGICVLKGKLATGVIGVVIPTVAFIGALRLAKPESYWGRRRYRGSDRRERKLLRAQKRFGARYQARRAKIYDLLGGRIVHPDQAVEPPLPAIGPDRHDD